MRTSEQTADVIAALVKARAAFQPLKKSETAKISDSRSYRYADLASLLDAVTPALLAQGLILTQAPANDDALGLVLVSRISHISGQWIEGVYPMNAYPKPQEMGSQVTYARRYGAQALLGLAAEDDDGKSAQDAQPQVSKPKGYDDWRVDMTACASEGLVRYGEAWTKSRKEFRAYANDHDAEWHAANKATAKQADDARAKQDAAEGRQ